MQGIVHDSLPLALRPSEPRRLQETGFDENTHCSVGMPRVVIMHLKFRRLTRA